MKEGILTVKELSTEWQVSEQYIYNLCKAGIIPFFKVGRLIRFNSVDINAYMGAKNEI